MKTKEFPRHFRSSSAAYRAIRTYCQKCGIELSTSGLKMTKIDSKKFIVSYNEKITFDEFKNTHPNVFYSGNAYRFFPDGVKGIGYYELKTGDRRRPNSIHKPVENVYNDLIMEVCE